MLILTRKLDQAIVIDGPCRIVVVGFEQGRVKLGIQAPDGVTVLREELVPRGQEQLLAKPRLDTLAPDANQASGQQRGRRTGAYV